MKQFKKRLRYLVLPFIFLGGCNSSDSPSTFSNDNSILDLNYDGVLDVSYENDEQGGYFEFIDSNFDLKVDQTHHYNEQDRITSSKLDDDFDGFLETTVFYKYGAILKVLVDANQDKLTDIIYYYDDGVLVYGLRYYPAINNESAKIGKVIFKYGYPNSAEVLNETTLTKKDFHDKQ